MTRTIRRRTATALTLAAVAASLVGVAQTPAHATTDDEYFDAAVVMEDPTFYPLVRDGFEDESVMVVGNSGYVDARATITDPLGRPVRTLQLTSYRTEDRDSVLRAAWDGRTDDGRPVEAGTYTVAFSADYTTVIDGEVVQPTVRTTRQVRVATGFAQRRLERTRAGAATSSRASGRACGIREVRDRLELACRRGTQASASWRVRLPAGATRVRWDVVAELGPRRAGTVRVSAERLRRVLEVAVVATGSQRALVESIVVRYTRRTRI